MVVLGVDVHKDTHTTVAVDQVGREVGQKTVKARDAGHAALVRWARAEHADGQRVWAIEDCRHVSTRLERALLAAGERVVRVPPKLMAGARASARTRGKSDPIDALAIARAALREPNLPVAEHDRTSRELKLLVDHREDLVTERTRMQSRVRWHLHELDPDLDIPSRGLDRLRVLDRLQSRLQDFHPAPESEMVARIAAELLADIRAVTVRVNALEREISQRVERVAPHLQTLPGVAGLTAAKIVGEVANMTRFRSEACFAMHAGVAPIPASSGRTNRHRLARGGNRQLNAALHRIAVTQARMPNTLGHTYYQRRIALGNTKMEAMRALKRRLARVVFTLLTTPTTSTTGSRPVAA
ncbi:IS110 family transposase [Pseudonocardia xishanensis]|uniref:IS110 family transposase n=1 Tax=Pseudonocardia xishanensis TaxID=630995 RepID=A0ABP8S1K1_9PSEU